ncbi:MAG TPA: hypothetical protein VFH18_00010 [Erysipelotrichaceae bacterium]|nr:hypothetical protein [Erysipelotrichaceae bacterium]
MRKGLNHINVLLGLEIIILLIITITGIQSFEIEKSFFVTNIYGQTIQLFGNGAYFYDSYFKAPIFIGTDFTILVLVLPALIGTLIWVNIKPSLKNKLVLVSLLGVIFYYSISISTGITYNYLFLFYISSVILSWISVFMLIKDLDLNQLVLKTPIKGYAIFLIITGIALFAIWLMDIIPTFLNGSSLSLIETYTTEVTYVYDMAFISPIMFLSYYLIKKNDGFGTVLLACMLVLCTVMGVMLPIQSAFQFVANIDIPIPVLIIKVGVFVLLACFSSVLSYQLFKSIE